MNVYCNTSVLPVCFSYLDVLQCTEQDWLLASMSLSHHLTCKQSESASRPTESEEKGASYERNWSKQQQLWVCTTTFWKSTSKLDQGVARQMLLVSKCQYIWKINYTSVLWRPIPIQGKNMLAFLSMLPLRLVRFSARSNSALGINRVSDSKVSRNADLP